MAVLGSDQPNELVIASVVLEDFLLRDLALRDVRQHPVGSHHPIAIVHGEPRVGLDPPEPSRLGQIADLLSEIVSAPAHQRLEESGLSLPVLRMDEIEKASTERFLHAQAGEIRPRGIQEGPAAAGIRLEDHLLHVVHPDRYWARLSSSSSSVRLRSVMSIM
jgi:hypothetical protein